MTSSTHKLFKAIAVVAACAGFAVPAATAATPDAFQRAVNVRNNAASYPDAVGRAVNIHNAAIQAGGSRAQMARHFQHEDAIYSQRELGSSQVANALGTPDTRDAAQLARIQVVRVESGGFDWADAGIGAGSGIAFLLLIGAGGSLVLRQKHRLSNA